MRKMIVVSACALLGFLAVSSYAAKQEPAQLVQVGDVVFLDIAGDLAIQYHELQDNLRPPAGIQISTSGQIVQRLPNETWRIEHTLVLNDKYAKPRLITLSAIVGDDDIRRQVVPAGTETFASPESNKSVVSTAQGSQWSASLGTTAGVTLRSWKLDRELTN